MKSRRHVALLITTTLLISLITAVTTIRTQEQRDQNNDRQKKIDRNEFKNRLPLADYAAPESTDPKQREKRHKRGEKYNKSSWSIDPADPSTDTVRVDYTDPNLPALPVAQSNTVLVAEVCDAQAYLSNDKTGVYSEFTVRIKRIFKNNTNMPLSVNDLINVEREGGRVRFLSGRIHTYAIGDEGVPVVGKEYVLFLKDNIVNQDIQFHIVTGYELNDNKVSPLDTGPQFRPYQGINLITFLSELSGAMADA